MSTVYLVFQAKSPRIPASLCPSLPIFYELQYHVHDIFTGSGDWYVDILRAIILLTTWSISLALLNWNGYVFLPLSQSSHCIQPFGRIERLWPGWALCSRVGSWQADHSGLSADSTLRSCGNKLLSWGKDCISKFIKVHSLSHLDSLLQNCFGNSSSWILVSLSVWESFRTRGGKKHNSDHCCRSQLTLIFSLPTSKSRPPSALAHLMAQCRSCFLIKALVHLML